MAEQGTPLPRPSSPPPPLQDGPYYQDEGYDAPSGPVFHIGEHATTVTVHVHMHTAEPSVAPIPSPPHTNAQHASVTMEVDMEPASSSRDTASRSTHGNGVAQGAGASESPMHDAIAALPEGLLSPTMQSVLRQVLDGTVGHTLSRASNEETTSTTGPATSASTGRNVAISWMMRPLSAGGNTSLSELFQQLSQDGPSGGGVPLAELNRHTELMTYAPGHSRHDTCGVCQEAMSSGQVVRKVLRCGHAFHSACLDQWLEANRTCPMCMQPVVRRADAPTTTTFPSPLQPPPPPPPPRTSRGRPFSPRTAAVVQQANALLADESSHATGTAASVAPSVHIQSATRRMRIPIRGATMAGADAEARPRPRMTPDAVLESALNELTLDTIDEVEVYDDTDTEEL